MDGRMLFLLYPLLHPLLFTLQMDFLFLLFKMSLAFTLHCRKLEARHFGAMGRTVLSCGANQALQISM